MLGRDATGGIGTIYSDLPVVKGPYTFRDRSDTINSNTFEETFIGNLHFQQSVFPPWWQRFILHPDVRPSICMLALFFSFIVTSNLVSKDRFC